MCCTQPISACYFLCNRFLLCVYSVWIVFRASFLFSLVLIWYTLISSDPVQCELSSRHTTLTIIFRFITDENWYPGGSLICVAICSCSEIYLRAFHAPTYPPHAFPSLSLLLLSHSFTWCRRVNLAHLSSCHPSPTNTFRPHTHLESSFDNVLPSIFFFFCFDLHLQIWRFLFTGVDEK